MKGFPVTLILSFGLWSCGSQYSGEKEDIKSIDTFNSTAASTSKPPLVAIDTTLYDQSFLKGLTEYNEPLKIVGNYILLGQDTVYFPEELPLNKETLFKGAKDATSFALSVVRKNMTSLQYSFQMLDQQGNVSYDKTGRATLGSLFFLGSETDDDDSTGEAYGSVEYWDESSDCSFAIRIGEKDNEGKLRARIKLSCNGEAAKNIDLNDCPTLRTN